MAAAAQSIALAPPAAETTLRAYALGMVPMEGAIYRFHGSIAFDKRDATRCTAELTAETATLTFSDASIQQDVLAPDFLDAAAFPTLSYRGACAGAALQGMLTLHGQTHPLALTLTSDGTRLVAAGSLDRTSWGITGRRFTVGSTVDIRIAVPLPEELRGRVPAPH